VHFASLSTLDVAGFSTFLVVALPLALLVSRSSADDRSPVRLGSPPLLPPPRRP